MGSSLAVALSRLLAVPERRRAAAARRLVARRPSWEEYAEPLQRAIGERPERVVAAARALRGAYRASGDRAMAARMGLIEARAVHRSGSPREAAQALGRAARSLEAVDDRGRALQARVLMVDALAHAGRVADSLRTAARLRPRLRRPSDAAWRHALEVNVANALRLRGDLEAARWRYERAARGLARAGQSGTAAIARMNAGVLLLEAGRGEEALSRFEAAAHQFEEAGAPDMALEAQYNRACAAVRAARVGDGIRTLQHLAAAYTTRGLTRREGLCRLDLAGALLRAGDLRSAWAEAERSASAFQRAGAKAERCEALLLAAAAAPEATETGGLLRRARRAAAGSGREVVVLRCDLLAHDLRSRIGAPEPVSLHRIAQRASALGQRDITAEAQLLLGEAALRAGRATAALARFRAASRHAAGRPWVRAAADTGMAASLARLGRTGASLDLLRHVTSFLEAVRSTLPGPWLRAAFVRRRFDPWLTRIDLLLDRGRDCDRAEAEALLEGLARQRFIEQARARPEGLHPSRQRQRLEALYDVLGRGVGPTRATSAAELEGCAAEAAVLEQRVAEEWRSLERSARVGRRTARARQGPATLAEGEVVLHVWAHDGAVRALVRTHSAISAPLALGTLERLESGGRHASFLGDRIRLFGASAGPSFATHLETLAKPLLAPIRGLGRMERLYLVLDPEVPDLPWEALPLDGRPLAACVELLRVPCAGLRSPVRPRRRSRAPTTFIAVGGSDLPGVAVEAAGLGRSSTLVMGEHATRAALLEALARPGVVQVSGHGLASMHAPPLGGVRMADGWFAAADVPPRVAADTVVLAACRSGLEQGLAAEAWGGLPLALLAAGARRVVWTAADVDDRAFAFATSRFHRELRERSPEAALGAVLDAAGGEATMRACLLPLRLSGMPW